MCSVIHRLLHERAKKRKEAEESVNHNYIHNKETCTRYPQQIYRQVMCQHTGSAHSTPAVSEEMGVETELDTTTA